MAAPSPITFFPGTTARFAPGPWIYLDNNVSTATSQWNTWMEPYYRNWINRSRGELPCAFMAKWGPRLCYDGSGGTRPSNETNPNDSAYDWTLLDSFLNSFAPVSSGRAYMIIRWDLEGGFNFPDWWQNSGHTYTPADTGASGRKEIFNWTGNGSLQVLKNFITAFATRYNSETKIWATCMSEQSGSGSVSTPYKAEFVNHCTTQLPDMYFWLFQNSGLHALNTMKTNKRVGVAIADLKPFSHGCGNTNAPGSSCSNYRMISHNAILGKPNGKGTMTGFEPNGWNIMGSGHNVANPFNVTLPHPNFSMPAADMDNRVACWYVSYSPRASGSKANSNLGQNGTDPNGIVPCTNIGIVPGAPSKLAGNTPQLINAAMRAFGQAGTEALFWPPDGFDPSGGGTAPDPDPVIFSTTDNSIIDGETNFVITGSDFEAVQGVGWVRLYENSDQTGTSSTQTITAWSDTSITITVAQGSLADDTEVYLFVQTDGGLVSSSFPLQIQATASQPTILSSGSSTYLQGDVIQITGTDFGASQGTGNITIYEQSDKLGNSSVQFINAWADTAITFTFNIGNVTSDNVAYLVVKNASGLESILIAKQVVGLEIPVILDAGNEIFDDGQQNVTITGLRFGQNVGFGSVELNDSPEGNGNRVFQTIRAWADTSIVIDINKGALSSDALYLVVRNTLGVASVGYEVMVVSAGTAPQIGGIDDSSIEGGQLITITGANFGLTWLPNGGVTLSDNINLTGISIEQQVNSWSDTLITFIVVKGNLQTDPLYLSMVTEDGRRSNAIEVTLGAASSDPVITSVSDSELSIGENFTINGSNFGADGTAYISPVPLVSASAIQLGITSWIDTAIGATMPTLLPGFGVGVAYVIVAPSGATNAPDAYQVTVVSLSQTLLVDDEHSTDYSDTAGFSDIASSGDAITKTNSAQNSGGTKTFSLTTTADDDLVIVRTSIDDTVDTVSAVSFGGTAMTKAAEQTTGALKCALWYMRVSDLPSPGANNVVVTSGDDGARIYAYATSYKDTKDAAPEDTDIRASTNTNILTGAYTTTTDGAWIIDVCMHALSSTDASASAGQVEEWVSTARSASSSAMGYEIKATAGVESCTWTYVSSARMAYAGAVFAPDSGTGSVPDTYNSNARVAAGDNSGDKATYYFYLDSIFNTATVYGWWPTGTWATDTPITITLPGGSPDIVDVDQNANTGVLYPIKSYTALEIGTMTVEIGDDANGQIVADLIQVQLGTSEPKRSNIATIHEVALKRKNLFRLLK